MPHAAELLRLLRPVSFLVGIAGLGAVGLCAARRAPVPARQDPADDAFNPSVQQQVVESGDTLWDITERVTGKPWVWPKVWAMNPEITNPHWIYPGDVIRFVPTGEAPPNRAEMVASSMDVPPPMDADSAADKAAVVPRVEVVNTARVPAAHTRSASQRVFASSFVSTDDLQEAGKLTNAIADKLLLRSQDEVYLSFPHDKLPKVGDRFLTYRLREPVEHPDSGASVGYLTEITGVTTVRELIDDVARARIDNAVREVERGQFLMPVEGDLILTVQPTAAREKIAATVVALEGGRSRAGEQALVFIDKGKRDGIERGNQLQIVSHGDPTDADTHELPGMELALLMAVEVRERTTTCLVVDSVREVARGDHAQTITALPPAAAPLPQ